VDFCPLFGALTRADWPANGRFANSGGVVCYVGS